MYNRVSASLIRSSLHQKENKSKLLFFIFSVELAVSLKHLAFLSFQMVAWIVFHHRPFLLFF